MATQDNKALLQSAVEKWNNRQLDDYLQIYADNVKLHGFAPGLPAGIAGARVFYTAFWAGFPDAKLSLDEVVGEGDKVAVRYTVDATHQGEFNGIPATEKTVKFTGITILRFSGGKCVERWNQGDMFGLLRQLSVFPGQTSITRQTN